MDSEKKEEISLYNASEEELNRQMRLEKFGKVDYEPDSYLRQLEKRTVKEYQKKERINQFKYEEDPDKIKPKKDKEEFRLNLVSNEPHFDKRRIMLFGVNLMNSNDIADFLGGQYIKKLYWLNDFTCVVEFDTEVACLTLFREFTGNHEQESSDYEYFNWKVSKGHLLDNRMIDIEMRISEEGDLLRKADKKDAIYYKYYARKEKPDYINLLNYAHHDKRDNKNHGRRKNLNKKHVENEVKEEARERSRSRSRISIGSNISVHSKVLDMSN